MVAVARYEAVIFDNDGLLLDTELAWTRAETTLFARFGHVFTDDHKRDLLGTPRDIGARKLERYLGAPGRGEELVDELGRLAHEEVLEGVDPRPGAVELLAALRAAGVPHALATNSVPEFVERVLNQAGLDDAFEVIVSVADVPRPKPAPDIYLEAARRLGQPPQACAALEDSPTGVAAAAAAGMFVIAVPYMPGMEMPGASMIAPSLADAAVWEALGLDMVTT